MNTALQRVGIELTRRPSNDIAIEWAIVADTTAAALEGIRDQVNMLEPIDVAVRLNDVVRYLKGETDAPT